MNRSEFNRMVTSFLIAAALPQFGCSREVLQPEQRRIETIEPVHEDFNQLYRSGALDELLTYERYTWRNNPPHDVTAFPSGDLSDHEDIARELGGMTYREAGYDLSKLQKILLRPFEDPRQEVNATSSSEEEALEEEGKKVFSYRYSLMPGAAIALRMMSDSIGSLKDLHDSLPDISLMEAIKQNYTEDHLRNAYRSFYLQLLANGNAPGASARAGVSTHGTGNSIDFPMYLVENPEIMHIVRMKAKEFGFLQPLAHPGALGPNPDLPHFEYVGSDKRNCPNADRHFVSYPDTYSMEYINKPLGRNLPAARNFPRPQDLVEYARHDPRISQAHFGR